MSTAKPKYLPHGEFHAALERRMRAHFAALGHGPAERTGMVLKTGIILAWFALSYGLLMFRAEHAWQAAVCAVSLGLSIAGIGFSVMHDGSHGAYPLGRAGNAVSALCLDFIGGSSYVWRWKHTVFHHSHPNVVGSDADIDISPFCRIAPAQPLRPAHRFQHLYIWFLYAFLALKWHFVDDFKDVLRGRIADQPFPRPRGRELAGFLLGKAAFYGWAVVWPLLVHPWWKVLLWHVVVSATVGVVMALIFQLAHVVEDVRFGGGEAPVAPLEWSAHQVASSRDFAPRNRLINWYVGGLNFQIEHHLFPRVSHVHLAGLAPMVEATCLEFGVPYRVHRTLGAALASHARWVRRMGASR